MIDFDELKGALIKGDVQKSILSKLHPFTQGLENLSSVFFFLSLCYRYPDKNIYKMIKDVLPEFRYFFEDYVGYLPELPKREEMETEYVRLFVTNYGGVIAVPYASHYLEEEGLLMGETTVALKDMMRKEGVVLKEDIKEVEDHIYILLEFCSALLNKIIDMIKNKQDFLKTLSILFVVLYNYIDKYVVDFSDKVIEGTDIDFYKDVSIALRDLFLDMDEILPEILNAGS